MSDMTFKANLIPDSNESYNIGSNNKKWKIYGRNYGTISHNKDLVTKEYSDNNLNIAKSYSDNNLNIAKSYSDNNLNTAEEYSDNNLNIAKSYSDSNLNTAKSYSDNNLNIAKSYSDSNLNTAKSYSDSNLNTAKSYSDNIVTISTTQPTAENNKLWINDSEEGIIIEVPTIQEAIALGVSNANIGQGIKISTIDADGCPVAWSPANFIELSFSSADAGKIPVVNSSGQLVLMTKSEWENSLT